MQWLSLADAGLRSGTAALLQVGEDRTEELPTFRRKIVTSEEVLHRGSGSADGANPKGGQVHEFQGSPGIRLKAALLMRFD
jgi:hypothetical protein